MREWIALALACTLGACASPPSQVPAPQPVATASDFVHAQKERAKSLQSFASRGSAELRWKDEQGSHFEQAQVELAWRDGGERMALRADKVGERIAWAGADATQWWIFEPKADPSRLTLGPRGVEPKDSALPFAGPDSVMELLAVRAWPASARLGEALPDGTHWLSWTISKPIGSWCATRARVSKPGALPAAVELLDARGAVLASSELSRPMSVEIATLPPGAWPEVAGTTRLRMQGDGGAAWDVFWDAPGTNPERLKDRLFDLNVLIEVMRPVVVRDQGAKDPR
jgi:hypothetical protein